MIGMIAMAAATAATDPVALAPSGKWIVDYQEQMCLVSRSFGPATATTMFAIKPAISLDETGQTLYLVTPSTGSKGVRHGPGTVTLQPSGLQKKIDYVSVVLKGTDFRGYEIYADADLIASLRESTGVAFGLGKESFAIATGKMGPVLKALTTCNETLLRSWGVDPAARASAASGSSPASWFPPDSYPAEAKRRGATGRSVIVVTVSPAGRSTGCRVILKADKDLDATSCRLAMRNGRFEPSTATADRYSVLAVRWELWNY